MDALKAKCSAGGIEFSENGDGNKYGVRYIPHLVIADEQGTSLQAYDSSALQTLHGEGKLADDVYAKADSLRK